MDGKKKGKDLRTEFDDLSFLLGLRLHDDGEDT